MQLLPSALSPRAGRVGLFSSALMLSLSLWVGCATEIEDVNRVQPHFVTKTQFTGVWYARQTIIDVPPRFALLFRGIEGALEKIEWEIRERQLIARRSYPVIPGLEAQGNAPGARYRGAPVAIFPIVSHFDIIRDYNPSTGEQGNVIREDILLNPWHERAYMRVDWSQNLAESPLDLSAWLQLDPMTARPAVSRWVRESEADDPDQLQIGEDALMVTARYTLSDGGFACYSSFAAPVAGEAPCGSVEVKLRHAFVRVDEERQAQFESRLYLDRELLREEEEAPLNVTTVGVGAGGETPVEVACTPALLEALSDEIGPEDCEALKWDHNGRFGFFRTERQRYDRRVGGAHDEQRIYLANHHQIWEATRDENGALIPPEDRGLKPVIYYLNAGFPRDLEGTALQIALDWDEAFLKAGAAATGQTPAQLRETLQERFEAEGDAEEQRALFLEDGGGEPIGAAALFQIRRNRCSQEGVDAYLERHPNLRGPLEEAGYQLKPIPTGQLKSLCARLGYESRNRGGIRPFQWQQIGDPRYSFLWWIEEAQPNGPLGYGPSSADPETGEIISGNAYVYGAAVDRSARAGAEIVRALNGDLCDGLGLSGEGFSCDFDNDELIEWLQAGVAAARTRSAVSPAQQREISRRIGGARGDLPRFERENGGADRAAIIRHQHRRRTHPDLGDPLRALRDRPAQDEGARLRLLEAAPELLERFLTPELRALLRPLLQSRTDERIGGDGSDEALRQLAGEYLFAPARFEARRDNYEAFLESHNIMMGEGLDGAVIGQAQALKGLEPEQVYTQLRREIFRAVALHEIGHTVGLRHNFKSSFDALNYPDEFWQIMQREPEERWAQARLPEYRYASIMDYGARFNSDTKGLGRYDHAAILYVYGGHAEVFEESVPLPGRLDQLLEEGDYRQIPERLGGDLRALTLRRLQPIESLQEERKQGVLRNAQLILENRDQSKERFWIDRTAPYFYCSDEYVGDLKCQRWDEGASHLEATESAIERYWGYYFFDSWRRGRSEGSFLNRFFGRSARVAEALTSPWKFYQFYDAYSSELRDDLLESSILALNFIQQALSTPEPGRYCRFDDAGLYLPDYFFNLGADGCDVYLPEGEGRRLWLEFSDEHIYRINSIGTYFDKINLLINLIDPSTRFFRVRDESDQRRFNVNYYRGFAPELIKQLGEILRAGLPIFSRDGELELLADPSAAIYPAFVDGALVPTPLIGDDPAPEGSPRLYHQLPYNLIWQSLALATIYNSGSGDERLDLLHYISIDEVGSGDERQFEEGRDHVRFVHPTSGEIYQSFQTRDGLSIAYPLLDEAQRFREGPWQQAFDYLQDAPEDEGRQRYFRRQELILEQFVELIHDLRQIRGFAEQLQ